jgi:hypothetical protein
MKENEENYIITVIGFNYRTRKEASVLLSREISSVPINIVRKICNLVIAADSKALSSFRRMVASLTAKTGSIPI